MHAAVTALFVCVLGCAWLRAEPLVVPVAGQGWQITLEGPVPAMESLLPNEQGLVYRCSAGRFSLAAVVEVPAAIGGDSTACREHAWTQAEQNPLIQNDSVKQWSTPACECVEYLASSGVKGDKNAQANIICCVAYRGKWVNVHAVVDSANDEDHMMLKQLAESLACGPFPEWHGGKRQFVLGDLGLLQIEVPAGWWVGNRNVVKITGLPDQCTVSLFSASDPNKSWLMAFFNSSARYAKLEDIQRAAENAQHSVASHSVEGAMNLQEIKLSQGVGCQAVYTDASLAGKPIEAGNPKVISSGFVAPLPNVLGTISIMADDVKDPYFQAAIKALGTIEFVQVKVEK